MKIKNLLAEIDVVTREKGAEWKWKEWKARQGQAFSHIFQCGGVCRQERKEALHGDAEFL